MGSGRLTCQSKLTQGLGVDVFLTKPCLPEDLEGHVRRLLERKGNR
jgi:DNA-binding response OmpR family regulator